MASPFSSSFLRAPLPEVFVECPVQTAFHKPLPGALHRRRARVQRFSDLDIRLTFVGQQQNMGTLELAGGLGAPVDEVE
jgi:hypothetical protein